MTKNINYVSHKKSKLKTNDGKPQLPSASALVEGEIAINYAENVETLSIKNESGDVVTFSSDNYYTEQKLGSAFTNSNVTVTDVIKNDEEVVSAALTDLDERKLDASAYTPTDLSNYYKKSETSGATELSTAFNLKANDADLDAVSGSVNSHITNTDIHVTVADKTKWNNVDSKLNTSDFNTYSGTVNTAISNKVDKVSGKDLSSNDFTDALKTKLDGIAEGAEANVQANWTESDATSDSYIQNKPTIPTVNDGTFTISGNGAVVVSTSANASANKGINIKAGTNITITTGSSEISISATGTAYSTGSSAQLSAGTDTEQRVWSAKNLKDGMDAVYTKITDSKEMEETLAAAITDVNSRAADKEELKALVNDYQDFKLMYENRRERKRFTNRDDFVARLKMAAADQNLERYGLKVGDYYTTTNGGKTYNYVIAGLNTMKGTHSYRLTTDHVGIIVDTNDTHAWNVSGNTYQSTNTYSTGGTWTTGASAAGYANCDLHYYLTTTVLPYVEADLGSTNIKSHYKLYSTAVNTSGYNRYGSAGGCSSSWAWYANQKICALSEVQVYGSIVWSSSGYDTGEACRQLDVFRVYNMNEIFEGRYPWLRDVASASFACCVYDGGDAGTRTASIALNVAALILFA